MNRILEKDIEDILEIHPYLIEEHLINGRMERQYSLNLLDGRNNFIDLLYIKDEEIYVIELKKNDIKKMDVSQLTRYVIYIRNEFPEQIVKGILVGRGINEELIRYIELRNFSYKELSKDIPLEIKLCSVCRKANSISEKICKWCGSDTFIK